MNSVAVYVPQETIIDLNVDNSFDVSDPWSQVAIKAQGATTVMTHFLQATTDRIVPLVYETQFRIPEFQKGVTGATPDNSLFEPKPGTQNPFWNSDPQFLLTRTAPPVQRPRGNSSEVLAEWDGFVTRIDGESFEARLTGLTGEGVEGEIEEATIPTSEITDTDRDLVVVGGLFRLCISYEKGPAGERRRYSSVVFRRLPAYRQSDLNRAHERTRVRLNALRVE